LSNQVIVGLV